MASKKISKFIHISLCTHESGLYDLRHAVVVKNSKRKLKPLTRNKCRRKWSAGEKNPRFSRRNEKGKERSS